MAASGFAFLLVNTEQGFDTFAGLLGLSRPNLISGYTQITAALLAQGKISSNIFAMYLADASQQSSLQLGGYDTQYFYNPSVAVNYIPLF